LITAESIFEHIKSIYRPLIGEQTELELLLSKNVVFITLQCYGVQLQPRSNPSAYIEAFARWYHALNKAVLGNHLDRKTKWKLQPLSYAFVDFPGSRKLAVKNPI
jgi:hypothetical protein